MRSRSDAAGAGTEASGESRVEQSDIYGKLLDFGTVACESAGEEIPTGGVESDPRWWARELVMKTEELISIFDEVDGDGGGSEEGCRKRPIR
ncbi:hypothetical protein ACFX2J_003363 [Malus domestica]